MNLSGKRVAVLVEQQYQEMEVWYPVYRLREAGCAVSLVGPEADATYPSKLGYPAKSDQAARNVSAADFDAVVIPGGFAPDYLRRHEAVLKLVRDAAAAGKVIASICHGPWVLCSTPALRGKQATCFFAIKDDLINAGATYVDAEVVRDGNLITSRKPDDLPAFLTAIIEALGAGSNQIFVIRPYLWEGVWVFDDPSRGLVKEALVAGIPAMIEEASRRLGIRHPEKGFVAVFSKDSFPDAKIRLDRIGGDGIGGTYYRWPEFGNAEGWLCPALLKYFDTAPEHLYIDLRPAD